MRRIAIVACLLLTLSLGACASDDDPAASPDATTSSAPASPTPEATPCVLEGVNTEPESVNNPAAERGTIDDVRPNDDGGCPRIVFQFQDQIPNYSVGYMEPPFEECGSGDKIDTSTWGAEAFIHVRMEPAGSGDINTGEPVYTGPNDIGVDGPTLKHLRRICDYEAVYEWVIGVSTKLPFAVDTLDEPARLVIDISEG